MGESGAARIKGAVQYRQQPTAGVGVVDRRAKNEAVGLLGLFNDPVDAVIRKDAAALPGAAAAGNAVPHRRGSQLDNLCGDPLCLQHVGYLPQGSIGAAIGVVAAVDE